MRPREVMGAQPKGQMMNCSPIYRCVKIICTSALGALFMHSSANADTALGVRTSTQGIGAEISTSIGKFAAIRGGFNFFSIDFNRTEGGINYDAELDLASVNLFLDLYPAGGPFRLTAGLVIDKNKIAVTATEQPSFTIGDMTFTEAETGLLEGTASFRDTTPYLGIGIGNPYRGGKWTITLDAGVYFLEPRVSLTSAGGTLSNDPVLLTELERERAELEDELDRMRVWPVIGITVTRRF